MVSPIIFQPQSGIPYETNTVSSQNWVVSPPEAYLFWMMNDAFPDPVSVKFSFPDYASVPQFEDYTDFQIETSSIHQLVFQSLQPSIPFSKVNDELNYVGDLGVLISGVYNKQLSFSFYDLNLLSEGHYLITTTVKVTAVNPFTGLREIIAEKKYMIVFYANAFSFLDTPPFEMAYVGKITTFFDLLIGTTNYTPIVFNYHQEGSLPAPVEVFFFGLKPQNLAEPEAVEKSDASIQTVYIGLHPYYSKLAVSFSSAIESLPLGTYNYTLGLGYYDDGDIVELIKTIPIILNVFPETVVPLLVTPDSLVFDVIVGGANPEQQTVSLVSTIAWEVISELPTWLSLSNLSGSGNATLIFLPVNYLNLTDGSYIHELIISNGTTTATILITMNVTVFLQNPFLPGKLNFTKDPSSLNFISQNEGNYIALTVTVKIYKNITYEEVVYERLYAIPLANKKGSFHLGSIVHDLFDEIESFTDFVNDFNSNYFTSGYKPAVVSLSYEEKQYITTDPVPELVSGQTENLMFIKGIRPFMTVSDMSLLTAQQQYLSRISKQSVIGLNFTFVGNPIIIVKRNNLVIDQLSLLSFGTGRFIYNYYRFINEFNVGDLIEIYVADAFESRCHRYLVHYDGLESTQFFFENQHGVFEPFELTGRRRISSNYKHTLNSKYKNLFAFDEKVKTNNIQSFVINPGNLHPEDHRIIDAMIKSEKIWCSFTGASGNYVRVNCITTKGLLSDTATNFYDFDLEFNILENSDAIFCI